ncbi:MAG TPA: hypothetical protein VMY37_18900, partial [Thermoguttaceae bacterium]|nr:hypothetical protein [Thermoguttaceae bacterium]
MRWPPTHAHFFFFALTLADFFADFFRAGFRVAVRFDGVFECGCLVDVSSDAFEAGVVLAAFVAFFLRAATFFAPFLVDRLDCSFVFTEG